MRVQSYRRCDCAAVEADVGTDVNGLRLGIFYDHVQHVWHSNHSTTTNITLLHEVIWEQCITIPIGYNRMLQIHQSPTKTAPSLRRSPPPSNTLIPRPTPLTTPNGIGIQSAVLPQYTFWTDRQTGRQAHGISDRSIPRAFTLSYTDSEPWATR